MSWRKYLFLIIFNPKLILLALHFRILTYEAVYLEMMDKYHKGMERIIAERHRIIES